MKLAVIRDGAYIKTVVIRGDFAYPLEKVAKQYDMPLATLVDRQLVDALVDQLQYVEWEAVQGRQPVEQVQFLMPKTNAKHVFGVGANYVEKAEDLNIVAQKPVCFLKTPETVVGPGDVIRFPNFSQNISAEGELALIIGKPCFEVSEEEALSYVMGYTTALDLTAKDLHAENPRFLQLSKLFHGSCSVGPEIQLGTQDLASLTVETVCNGEVVHRNTVANMMYTPAFIVSYISKFVTLVPGDIILTGTPGSFNCVKGDIAECRVTGLAPQKNQVQ